MIYNKLNVNNEKGMRGGQMQERGERPKGEPSDMQNIDGNFTPPEKPEDNNIDVNNNL